MNDTWLYPVKSGQNSTYVEYTEQLIKQAIFGKQVQNKLIESTSGLRELIKELELIAKKTGGITTLGGRFIPVNSSHKCLNYFCQGQGAESIKYYIKIVHEKLSAAGLTHGIDFIQQATIYDELDFIVKDQYVDLLYNILLSSYTDVSRALNMQCTYTGEVMIGGRNNKPNNWWGCH